MPRLFFQSGDEVSTGTYFSVNQGEWITIREEGEKLPVNDQGYYLRKPLAILAAPFLGLAYLFLLPLTGFVFGGGLMVLTAARSARRVGRVPAPEQGSPVRNEISADEGPLDDG